jgi:alkylation response protein AidB-like acyl-CoA dehydrogenase
MITQNTTLREPVLSDATLKAFGDRASGYDRENRFCSEDFEALVAAGFLKMPIPTELGGLGMNHSQVCAELRRLATRAPATAVAINMHIYWMGVAADLWRAGDKSLEWVLKEGAAGEVYAAGHAESGNDLPVFLSTTKAEKVDGGYRITGHKFFGSLSPVWTRLGFHAMDTSNPEAPVIVHGFLPRDAEGYTIGDSWDTLGMRGSRSDDTRMEGAFCPDSHIGHIIGAGQVDAFILSMFAWALIGLANVYYGVALRARELAIEGVKNKTSLGLSRSMAYHPEVQHAAAEMTLEIESVIPQLDQVSADWTDGIDHGAEWPMKIVAAKYRAVESAKRVVDLAMDMSGGSGFFKANELERLYRDVRAGGFHPANTALTHEIVGKTTLGIDMGEQPRWG